MLSSDCNPGPMNQKFTIPPTHYSINDAGEIMYNNDNYGTSTIREASDFSVTL